MRNTVPPRGAENLQHQSQMQQDNEKKGQLTRPKPELQQCWANQCYYQRSPPHGSETNGKNILTQQITEARKEQTCAQSLTDQLDTENLARIKDLKGAQTTAEQGEQLERATQDHCRIVTLATAQVPDQPLGGAMEKDIPIPRTPWYVQQQSTTTSSFTPVAHGCCTRTAEYAYC